MMSCREITNDLLLDLVEAQLAPDDLAAIEEHARRCGACRRRIDEIRTIAGALRTTPVTPNETLLADKDREILHEIRAIAAENAGIRRSHEDLRVGLRRRVTLFRWLGAAAAAVLLVITGLLVTRQSSPVPQPTTEERTTVVDRSTSKPIEIEDFVPLPVPLPAIPDAPKPPAALAGDANGDGVVNIADSLTITRAVAEDRTGNLSNGDADRDGSVTIADALWISRRVAEGVEPKGGAQ